MSINVSYLMWTFQTGFDLTLYAEQWHLASIGVDNTIQYRWSLNSDSSGAA